MAKFRPVYRLTIEYPNQKALVIENPITIDFKVTRSIYAGTNSLEIDIYNLNDNHRNQIFQDIFDPREYRKIILEAGYTAYSTIFIGNLYSAYTTRSGTDIVTHIQALDGGLDVQTGYIDTTLEAGTNMQEVISHCVGAMPHTTQGQWNLLEDTFNRPVVLRGNVWGIIKKYTEGKAYIDMEELNIMNPNDVKDGYVPYIDDAAGLLKVPERRGASITVTMTFEPQIVVGQVIEINSTIAPQFNGQYKVIGLTHQGMISDAQAGQRTTTLELWVGGQVFGRFNRVAVK